MSEKLYNFLSEQGDYTKSYEDFQTQFANEKSQGNLYNFMKEKGDYTKSSQEFGNQFFPKKATPSADATEDGGGLASNTETRDLDLYPPGEKIPSVISMEVRDKYDKDNDGFYDDAEVEEPSLETNTLNTKTKEELENERLLNLTEQEIALEQEQKEKEKQERKTKLQEFNALSPEDRNNEAVAAGFTNSYEYRQWLMGAERTTKETSGGTVHSVPSSKEVDPNTTDKFLTQNNGLVVVEDMNVDEIAAENDLRQNTGFETWYKNKNDGTMMTKTQALGIGIEALPETIWNFGGDLLTWNFGDDKEKRLAPEDKIRAEQMATQRALYEAWKNKYSTDELPASLQAQDMPESTLEEYVRKKIVLGELTDEFGNTGQEMLSDLDELEPDVYEFAIQELSKNIYSEYNGLRTEALKDKDQDKLITYFGTNSPSEEQINEVRVTQEELDKAASYNPLFPGTLDDYKMLDYYNLEGGMTKDDMGLIFGDDASADVDKRDFRNWFETQDKLKGKMDRYYNLEDTLATGRKIYSSRLQDNDTNRELLDSFRAEVMDSYFLYKSNQVNEEYKVYDNLGARGVINSLNTINDKAERINTRYNETISELDILKNGIEDGSIENTQENRDKYKELANKANQYSDAYKEVVIAHEDLMNPKNEKILKGFQELQEKSFDLKKMRLSFLENTQYGKIYSKKNNLQELANKGERWFDEGLGIGNTIADIVSWIPKTIGGVTTLAIGGLEMVGAIDEEDVMIARDQINLDLEDYTIVTDNTPTVDPVTMDVNMDRLLPNIGVTAADMAFMIYTGGRSYAITKAAGRYAARKLPKIAVGKTAKILVPTAKSVISGSSTAIGSLPVIFPGKLDEAMSQISEDFTPEDAWEYAKEAAATEALIEVINPDWKWTRLDVNKIRRTIARSKNPGQTILNYLKNARKIAFQNSLKSVAPEILEEYTQNLANGTINRYYNENFNTDFEIPGYAEYKETAILTAGSVLLMRGLSGNLTKMNKTSMYRAASENYGVFTEALELELAKTNITEKRKEELLQYKKDVDNYTVVSAEIDDLIWDDDGKQIMTFEQQDRLIERITQRNALQQRIKENPNDPLVEDLKKELQSVEESINNERNRIESENNQQEIDYNNFIIKGLNEEIRDPETTEARKKELTNKRAKLYRSNKKLKAFSPEYSMLGKSYDNKAAFIKAVRAAKYGMRGKKDRKNLRIKIKNDVATEKETYNILGKYAPKNVKSRVVMTAKQAAEAETFIDKRTELELRQELKQEESKAKGQRNKDKIQNYKDALKYLALKEANYQFGKKGFLVEPVIIPDGQLRDLRLEGNIDAVKRATEQFGGGLEVLTNDEILERYGPVAMGANGFFAPRYDNEGNIEGFTQVINKDIARKMEARSVASHEMLHNILFGIINGPMRQVTDPANPDGPGVWVKMSEQGRQLIEGFLETIGPEQTAVLDKMLDDFGYKKNQDGSEKAWEEYGEEYLNMYHDAVVNPQGEYSLPNDTKEGKSIIRRVIDYFNNIFNSEVPGIANIEIQDGKDLFQFMRSYNSQAIAEKFGEEVVELGKKSKQDQKDTLLADEKNKDYQKALKAQEDGGIQMSKTVKALDVEAKADLFSKTNQELSMSLQAYGLEGEFDPNNQEHLDIWNSIPKKDKLFIGYSVGNLWRSYAKNKLFIQYGNTPNYSDYENDILDVLTTGIEVGQNGLPYIVSTWDPTQRKLTSHIWDLLPTRIPHVTRLPQFAGFGKALDDTYEDSVNKNLDDAPIKTNVLKFDRVRNKIDALKNTVKVKQGDTFTEISNNNTGRVSGIIFGVPQEKITDPKKNLTYAKKIVGGIPESSEAGNIQDFYRVGENARKLIKILPKINVSSSDADINEIGENIQVSRNVLGKSLGLSNRMLKYFYNKTNRRSKGLSTQPYIWELKPEFKNPSQETIDKLKEDLGITPQGELNNYDRGIGQLLKGIAKFQSQQTALSIAQRALQPTAAQLKQERAQEVKQQIADIKAGMSPLAFSRTMTSVDRMIGMYSEFDLGIKGKDVLLKDNNLKPTLRIKSVKDIPKYVDMLKRDVFPLLPKEAFFGPGKGTAFTSSAKNLGMSSSDPIWPIFQKTIQDLKNDNSIVYGDPIPGVKASEMWSLRNKYDKLFKSPEKIKSQIKEIKEFNSQVSKIHEALWKRINNVVKQDPNSATGIATYLGLVANDTGHWHKLGAQFAGYSTEITGKRYEYEHAMPATAAYLYLLQSALNPNVNFDVSYELVVDNYKLIALDKAMDDRLRNARTESGYSLQRRMPDNWSVLTDNWWDRYFNDIVIAQGGIDPNSIVDLNGKTFAEKYNIEPTSIQPGTKEASRISDAIIKSRTVNPSKGITVLDFDDTLATTESLVRYIAPDGTEGTLNAEEYASQYQDLLDRNYEFDFSEFNRVVKGKIAPLFQKALKLQSKFGPENMFVLTARPSLAQKPIFDFLKANGLNIPLKNITGLGNSTAEAKALWIADKVADGYNDFYFADDALQNVQAVDNMLEQFDVKRKVQQAKLQFSKTMSGTFNDIIEQTTGIESQKQFSNAQAKLRGRRTKYKYIVPPSAQDFAGLLYNFLSKGKTGELQMEFFKKALIDPFARGINELNSSRQTSANDYKNLLKANPLIKKLLNKQIEGLDYNYDQAIRVYLWSKAGFDVPGLSKRDSMALTGIIENDPKLKKFAQELSLMSKRDKGYSEPKDYWLAENITSDLLSDGAIGDARSLHLAEWQQNVDQMFSPENLNKIESIYGSKFREALEDVLYRMKTGRNRPSGGGRLMNSYMNWLNNSVGAIMFFNMRSAILQTISATNYINWSDNNPLKAAAAFANQPQYWKDFVRIFNSDYLKQRRSGNQRGINEAELSAAIAGSENKAKAAIAWLLKKGFLPTQLADSFAISSGGATFFRNRTNKYVKEGMTQQEAENQAWLDFQETTEVSQQSARPDMISQQQASPLGRLILAFQNTPMQYARIMNKAARDLVNGRGDVKTHISKIAYYGVVQSIIFGALQSALFAAIGDDEEEEYDKKKERIMNGMVDSWLSGIGYGGKAVSTIKNTIMEFLEQKEKGYRADHAYTLLSLLGFSPPIGSKLRKIYSSIQTDKWNEGVFTKRGLTLDNPIWQAIGNVVEGITNLPLGRLSNKMLNIDNAMDSNNEWWQRVALVLGWNTWDLGIRDKDIEAVKTEIKEEKKVKKKEEQKIKKEIKKKEKEEANKAVIEENKKKSKKDGICSAISKGGERCKSKAVNGGFCTVHEKAPQRKDGKKTQCKKIKSNGKRCGMKTSASSGYCYYHD